MGSECPYYNDLATLFLGDREGVISQLMRMRGHTYNATLLKNSAEQCSPDFEREEAGVLGPRFTERSLVLFLLLNFCCLILAFGISVPSGLFMPSIMTGAAFGGLLGIQLRKFVLAHNTDCWIMAVEDFDHHLVPGLYALVGSAAMLAGVFRSSISLAVILLEGTGQIQYLLPILLTIGVAKITADIFVDGLNEVQLDLKEMPFLHREPARDMVCQIRNLLWQQLAHSPSRLTNAANSICSSPWIQPPERSANSTAFAIGSTGGAYCCGRHDAQRPDVPGS